MAYKGLASVMSPKRELDALEKLAAKKKAEHLATSKAIGENVVGIPAAVAAGVLTKGNPAAIMAAYETGKGIGGMGAEAVTGAPVSKQSMDSVVSGGAGLVGAKQQMEAAKAAAEQSKQIKEMYNFLLT